MNGSRCSVSKYAAWPTVHVANGLIAKLASYIMMCCACSAQILTYYGILDIMLVYKNLCLKLTALLEYIHLYNRCMVTVLLKFQVSIILEYIDLEYF